MPNHHNKQILDEVHSRGECPRHAGVPPPTPPVPQLYFF